MKFSRVKVDPHLVIMDAHVAPPGRPGIDHKSWAAILKRAKARKWAGVHVIGDFGDFDSINGHNEGLRGHQEGQRLLEDVRAVRVALDELESAAGRKLDNYIEGNHEERWQRHCARYPELTNLVSIPDLLRLKDGVWKPYQVHEPQAWLGKLGLHHGYGAGKTSLGKMLSDFGCSILCGHYHRQQRVPMPGWDGTRAAVTGGWTGSRRIQRSYPRAATDWQRGYVEVYVERESGLFQIYNPAIFGGDEVGWARFVAPDGSVYSA